MKKTQNETDLRKDDLRRDNLGKNNLRRDNLGRDDLGGNNLGKDNLGGENLCLQVEKSFGEEKHFSRASVGRDSVGKESIGNNVEFTIFPCLQGQSLEDRAMKTVFLLDDDNFTKLFL